MGHSLEIQTSPSGQHVLLLGNNQGLLDAEQAPGTKLAASHFPFLRSIPQRQECIPRKRQAVLRKAESWISLQLGGHHKTYSSVISFCLISFVYFCVSGRCTMFPDLRGVAFSRRRPRHPSSALPSGHQSYRLWRWPLCGPSGLFCCGRANFCEQSGRWGGSPPCKPPGPSSHCGGQPAVCRG